MPFVNNVGFVNFELLCQFKTGLIHIAIVDPSVPGVIYIAQDRAAAAVQNLMLTVDLLVLILSLLLRPLKCNKS